MSAASVAAGMTAVPPVTIRSNMMRPPLDRPRGELAPANFHWQRPSPTIEPKVG
jgi:hypothetical protein